MDESENPYRAPEYAAEPQAASGMPLWRLLVASSFLVFALIFLCGAFDGAILWMTGAGWMPFAFLSILSAAFYAIAYRLRR
jgi:hypothetical protein